MQRTIWRARHFHHFLVWLLIWTAAWDSFGLLAGGDSWFQGPSYEVLRVISSRVGGMRAYGVPLGAVCLALMLATTWSYGRSSAGRRPARIFALCLSLLAGWYAVWCVGLVTANVNELIQNHDLLSWTAVSKIGFVTAVAIRLAMLPPPPPAPHGNRTAPGDNGGTDSELSG